jgi:phosphinothricin acetyltransferase
VEDDLPAVLGIYNASILTTTTWSEQPQTLPEREQWFADRRAQGDAVLVADDGGEIAGFAAYGEFRDNRLWPGYRLTVENTVHVLETHQRRGVGRALMTALIERAAQDGKHAMIAAVDSENDGSIAFHQSLGFVEVGRLPEIGWKFDRWLDLVLLQLQIST